EVTVLQATRGVVCRVAVNRKDRPYRGVRFGRSNPQRELRLVAETTLDAVRSSGFMDGPVDLAAVRAVQMGEDLVGVVSIRAWQESGFQTYIGSSGPSDDIHMAVAAAAVDATCRVRSASVISVGNRVPGRSEDPASEERRT